MVCFAEPLEVYDLPFAQKPDSVTDVWVIAQAQDIVVGYASFLLRRQVLGKISDHISSHLHGGGAPGRAGGGGGVDAGGVVHKIGVKACCADLLVSQVPGQLMDDSADHLQMPQLLRTDIGQQPLELGVGHGEPLAEVTQGRTQLTIWAPKWCQGMKAWPPAALGGR